MIIYVIGATNAGKSTTLDCVRDDPNCGLVEIGKMMRAKYPPSHFAGQSNPKHTAAEAWAMYQAEVAKHIQAGKKIILVDGQPRDMEQLEAIVAEKHQRAFLHLYAHPSIRRQRAEARDGSDPEKLKLSLARMEGDLPSLYNIVSSLMILDQNIITYDTSRSRIVPALIYALARITERKQ